MIVHSKQADECREAGPVECWCLHGAVGAAADWRDFAALLGGSGVGTRAVDLWRFLECGPLSLAEFGAALNAEAGGAVFRGSGRVLLGYSMGGRLALHALLEENHPWQAAVIVSAHPGLEDVAEREARRAADAVWASRALTAPWREFVNDWEAQPMLAGAVMRGEDAAARLAGRRREIARSFVDWSLGAQLSLWEKLERITVPVLWVVGEGDAKFLDLGRRAVSRMPSAALAVAPAAGHRVPWQAGPWLARQVVAFLSRGGA